MKKILITDDEFSYRKFLNDRLTKNGYDILEARDGREGLALAKLVHPDLILLDISMPVMSGIAMLDKLRKDTYGKSAKVIILTNLEPDDRIVQNVLKNKSLCYLIKNDIQPIELFERIDNILY